MEQAKNEYRIGELADSCGLSRDTLRYYEKRGLILPKKGENQYRYYTKEDFDLLISLTYQRRMDIGLDDMERLSGCGKDYVEQLSRIAGEQMEKEQKQILRSRQNLARLRQQQADCAEVREYLNQVRPTEFPGARIIIEDTECRNDSQIYLQYAHRFSGLDMMYALDEYRLTVSGGSARAGYRKSSWMLFEHLAEYTEYPLENTRRLLPFSCLCMVIFSQRRRPDTDYLSVLLADAGRRGLTPAGTYFLSPMIYRPSPGHPGFYFRVYLPVQGNGKGSEPL